MSQRGPIGVNGSSTEDRPAAAQEEREESTAQARQEAHGDSPRKPKSERENAFDAAGWLLQGLAGLGEELRHNDLGLPEEFWIHAYAARKEALLAARSLIDVALERCAAEAREAAKKSAKPPQRGNVSIDFG